MTKFSSGRVLAAVCSGLFLAGIALLSTAHGDEPACPKCSANQQGVPLLSKIPYVSRLFKTAKCEDCQGDFERIGVDFDIEVCEHCPPPASASRANPPLITRWVVVKGEKQPKVLACEAATCGVPVARASNCAASNCKAAVCCEAAECCQASCSKEASSLSQDRIIEIYAENAALKATLEAQSAFHKEKLEMLEMLAGLSTEKAKLESQLETLVHQSEATKETLALMSENARLKAQVEAAEAKLTIVHEMAKLAMENEQLKLALQKRQNHGLISNEVQDLPAPEEVKSRPAKLER